MNFALEFKPFSFFFPSPGPTCQRPLPPPLQHLFARWLGSRGGRAAPMAANWPGVARQRGDAPPPRLLPLLFEPSGLQTLAPPFFFLSNPPLSPSRARRAALDSSSPASSASIPRSCTFTSPSSSDSSPHPARFAPAGCSPVGARRRRRVPRSSPPFHASPARFASPLSW